MILSVDFSVKMQNKPRSLLIYEGIFHHQIEQLKQKYKDHFPMIQGIVVGSHARVGFSIYVCSMYAYRTSAGVGLYLIG